MVVVVLKLSVPVSTPDLNGIKLNGHRSAHVCLVVTCSLLGVLDLAAA